MCGFTDMNGQVFCIGLQSLKNHYGASPKLQSLISPVTYLMREATFQSRHVTSLLGKFCQNIRPLGELLDMFHTREASVRHDKIYALLGMSSDDLAIAGISPDYNIEWKQLFKRLIHFLLHEQIAVTICSERAMAILYSKGRVLGYVTSVQKLSPWDNTQSVGIAFNYELYSREKIYRKRSRWILHTSAKPVREGDIVCLLQGTSRPMIIRFCKEHFDIIMITTGSSNEREDSPLMPPFSQDFLLVWDWEAPAETDRNSGETKSGTLDHSQVKWESYVDRLDALFSLTSILSEVKRYDDARLWAKEAEEICNATLTQANPKSLAALEKLVLMNKACHHLQAVTKLLEKIVQQKEQVLGKAHPEILNDKIRLTSSYMAEGRLSEAKRLHKEVLKRLGHVEGIDRTDILDSVAELADRAVCGYVGFQDSPSNDYLDKREVRVQLDILKLVKDEVRALRLLARTARCSTETMALLLDRMGDDAIAVEELQEVAGGKYDIGQKNLELLLDRMGNTWITSNMLRAAAENLIDAVGKMELLLDRTKDTLITSDVLQAAAGNNMYGKEIMELLLDRTKDTLITSDVLKQRQGIICMEKR
jgi:tetratricopeptide (TPR) repeat protein